MYLLKDDGEMLFNFSNKKMEVTELGTLRISPSSKVNVLDSKPSKRFSTVLDWVI